MHAALMDRGDDTLTKPLLPASTTATTAAMLWRLHDRCYDFAAAAIAATAAMTSDFLAPRFTKCRFSHMYLHKGGLTTDHMLYMTVIRVYLYESSVTSVPPLVVVRTNESSSRCSLRWASAAWVQDTSVYYCRTSHVIAGGLKKRCVLLFTQKRRLERNTEVENQPDF